jgi:hypothetical protein
VFLTSKLITCFVDGFTSKREFQSIVHLLTMNWDIYIKFRTLKMKRIQYGIYEQTAFNPGEGQHAWRTNRVLKDNLSEGQHHGIEEIILKVGDIGEERRSGRDARTVWAGKRKVSGGLWWWWVPPASVTPDRARRGSFSVRPSSSPFHTGFL